MLAVRRSLVTIVLLYATWMGMMAIHECGHMLHAWASGGRVARVSLPWVGFSQTFFRFNPHSYFVEWGGPVWGSVAPVILWAFTPKRWRFARVWMQFFAGFCLIANGSYLGVGWITRTGDAGDLLAGGTPIGVMIAFGVVTVSAGLYLWHLLGSDADDKVSG